MSRREGSSLLILVRIDLANADMAAFETYEAGALALLADHGAGLEERVRAVDGSFEIHLLRFPDHQGLDAFRSDPRRAALQPLWDRCGASSSLFEVVRPG